jgi:phytoene desaturase
VVVVGAGVGGLCAAVRLAAAGHRVTVYERSDVVGGKLGRYARETSVGTFRFDTGPSLLTLPQVFADLDLGLDPVPLDPVVRHRFADGTVLDSCADPSGFADRIEAVLGPDAAHDWRRLWRRAARVWDTSWRQVLTAPVDSPVALVRLAWRVRDLAAVAPGLTLRRLGRRYLRDPRLRMLLDRYATYAGADPRRAPAALVAIPYAELRYGGWYLPGGLGTLADALLARAGDAGARVVTGAPVACIDAVGGRVRAVVLDDRSRVPADVVVANADALHVYRDLLPRPRRATRLAERSLAGFVLLLGARGRTPGLTHHTVHFPADYDAEFDAVFGGRLADDPTVFVTAADDPRMRPHGHEAWFVLVNAAPQGPVDWTARGVADAYADRIVDRLGIRDRLLFREVRTPADLQAATATPGGAIYGTPAHRLRRPGNRGPVRGLYLVGGSVHPGGGLPMVALSARIVAGQVGPA